MKTAKIILIISIIFYASCQHTEQHSKLQSQAHDEMKAKREIDNRIKVFTERNKHTDSFLYLNYWIGMDSNQFHIITDSLIGAKTFLKTDNTDFLNRDLVSKIIIFGDTLNIFSHFDSGKLYGIELRGLTTNSLSSYAGEMSNSILNLYKEKYGVFSVEKPKSDRYIQRNGDIFSKTKTEYGT